VVREKAGIDVPAFFAQSVTCAPVASFFVVIADHASPGGTRMIPFRTRLLPATLPLLLAAAASCSDPVGSAPAPGPLLFEVEWVGTGSFRFWSGYSIDAQGGVYSYSSGPDPIAIPEGDVYTAAELQLKYAQNRVWQAQLPDGETELRYAEAGLALRAGLTQTKSGCAGMAIERFYVLVYDRVYNRYTRKLLHMRGGMGQANTAPQALGLYHWLAQVTNEGYSDGSNGPNECDPYE
jgi:hypothetical protein